MSPLLLLSSVARRSPGSGKGPSVALRIPRRKRPSISAQEGDEGAPVSDAGSMQIITDPSDQ